MSTENHNPCDRLVETTFTNVPDMLEDVLPELASEMRLEKMFRAAGFQPIVSEAQANQLLRREIKQLANWQQRRQGRHVESRDILALLRIKPGNWYKLLAKSRFSFRSILIWKRSHSRGPR